jgi:phytoene dehydrogenase-like protein
MLRSTAARPPGLDDSGAAWKRVFGPPSRLFEELSDSIMRPLLRPPRHPLLLARFGLCAALPATTLARRLGGERAAALFAGVAAHSFAPLNQPLGSSVGMALTCAGHSNGWPVAVGGSQAIADALAAVVGEHGGRIETGRRVESLDELPPADAVVLDLTPGAVLRIAGERLPPRVARAYARYRPAPAAFKVDLAVEGGVPWQYEPARRAGTVHVAGGLEEVVAAEREINRGRMPERPFVLVCQQYLADASRSSGDLHPVWSYAHVPHGHTGDATEAVLDQIERFAPGLRERIAARHVRTPAQLAEHNASLLGGDIVNGANTPRQLLLRPRLALNPYATGIPGVFVCSAATPPGGGAHGICGHNAALAVLRTL